MTREQIEQAAQTHRETFFDNKSREGRIAKASFIEGAILANSMMIEHAAEWLRSRLLPLTNLDKFINEFKKAMENESK